MTAKQPIDKDLYSRQGVIDKGLKSQPLRITERPFQHRATVETDCYDCGQLIAQGEPFIVSALECTKGVRGTQHRYSVHLACYDIVGRVVAILGKDATHAFEGRPSLREMWKAHAKAIGAAVPELAGMLEQAFGKVKS